MKRLLIVVISLLCLASYARAAEFEAEANLSGVQYKIGLGMPFFDVVCSTTATTCVNLNNATITGTTTFTGPGLFPDGTAAAPGVAFASAPSSGMFWSAGGLGFSSTGTNAVMISGSTVRIASATSLGWTASGAASNGAGDVTLFRDAADTLAQRRSTNAQTFRLYKTFTDSSNGSWFEIDNSQASVTYIRTKRIGSGSNSMPVFQGSASKNLTEGSATSIVQFGIGPGNTLGGFIDYWVDVNDGTDFQARSGRVAFQAVNKGAVETCVVSGSDGTAPATEAKDGSSLAASTGATTLTYTWGADTSPTNACTLTLNATSSLAQSLFRVFYRVTTLDGGIPQTTITPQ